jgi:quercetin dioxygenase-like cupin family protein
MFATGVESAELSESWIVGEQGACWRSTAGHTSGASGSSLLEVEPGRRLPRHSDSAEELVVVVAGTAAVTVADETSEVQPAGSREQDPLG